MAAFHCEENAPQRINPSYPRRALPSANRADPAGGEKKKAQRKYTPEEPEGVPGNAFGKKRVEDVPGPGAIFHGQRRQRALQAAARKDDDFDGQQPQSDALAKTPPRR
jgi:hypothetical protein